MLANVLAVLLGFGSVIFYVVAFLYPEVHRRSDWVWSALGLVYAADLWFSAKQMTSAVLLGQVVPVALLLGLGWQTLSMRREKTPVYQQTPVVLTPEVVGDWAKSQLNQLRIAPAETVRPATLRDRPLTGSTTKRLRQGLNQGSDPRKRPLYDYEFVEDGILESMPLEVSKSSLEASEEPVLEAELSIDPPSATAEVIAVQTNETSQSDRLQSAENQSAENKNKASESEAPEPEPLKMEAVKPDDSESVISQSEISADDALEAKTSEFDEDDRSDNWGDSWSDDWGNEPESAGSQATTAQLKTATLNQSQRKPAREQSVREQPVRGQLAKEQPAKEQLARKKPSLLAMPGIVIGWVKDVAQSLTKPKPSKPVIDIPRREVPPPVDTNGDDSNWID
ncbi:MAG: Ycf66 family protein [Cyanobacteria bacterium P01_D01_bin.1]